jgi:hypothetical protein
MPWAWSANLVVKAGEAPLMLRDEARRESALAVARDLDCEPPVIGQTVLPLVPLR